MREKSVTKYTTTSITQMPYETDTINESIMSPCVYIQGGPKK